MSSPFAADYQELSDRIGAAGAEVSPAEAQGMLCGLICGGEGDELEARWLDAVFGPGEPGDVLAAEARRAWIGAAASMREAIEGPGMGLTLLLPGDDRPLAERAGALRDWSDGFLHGLGLLGAPERTLPSQTREVLRDFSEITRMDLDALDGSEEDESALEELTEFVWVAAMLVYEEVARKG